MRKYDIELLVTISQYELPFYLVEHYNGWSSIDLIDFYLKYCEAIFTHYKDKVKYWLTFNETNCATMPFGGYLGLGILNEGTKDFVNQVDIPQLRYQGLHHQFVASAKAVLLGHKINPQFQIGCMIAFMTSYPYTCNPKDILKCQKDIQFMNYYCGDVQVRGEYLYFARHFWKENNIKIDIQEDLEVLKAGKVDFYDFSYYMTNCSIVDTGVEDVSGNMIVGAKKNPYLETSDWGWQIDSDGLCHTLNEIYARYQIPLMVVENELRAFDKIEEDDYIHDQYIYVSILSV